MKKIITYIFVIMITMCLIGCIQPKIKGTVKLDLTSIKEDITVSEFNLNLIKIIDETSDERKELSVSESMITEDDMEKLKTDGNHVIKIYYKNYILEANIILFKDAEDKVIYNLNTEYLNSDHYIKDFNLGDIKILKIINSEVKEEISVTKDMISSNDFDLLSIAGNHNITINYNENDWNVTVKLKNNPVVTTTYEIDKSSVKQEYYVNSFSVSSLRIIEKAGNSIKYINVTEEMLSKEDLNALKNAGTHNIKINYLGHTIEVKITLKEKTIVSGTFDSNMAYYSNANGKSGQQLKLALRNIISSTKHTETYDDLKTDTKYSDADPNKSGNILLFYTRKSVKGSWDGAKSWNREHVWPQSLGWFKTSGAGSDLHHLRPEDPVVNSTRGNHRFGDVKGTSGAKEAKYGSSNGGGGTGCYYAGDFFEPLPEAKGDVARIIFYLMTRYSQSDSYQFKTVAQSKELLFKWASEDPVDELERTRNEEVYKIQGNRNPFIDNPDAALLIWETEQLSMFDLQQEFMKIFVMDLSKLESKNNYYI